MRRIAIILVEVLVVSVVTFLRWCGRADTKLRSDDIIIIGFLESASGLGAAARGLASAIAEWCPRLVSISRLSPSGTIKPSGNTPEKSLRDLKPAMLSQCAIHVYNPDVFARLIISYGLGVLSRNKLNLVVINWETGVLPKRWKSILSCYDILAAPSTFTAEAVCNRTGRRVHVVPNCVLLKEKRTQKKDNTAFQFLVVCDSLSSLSRKNPHGALRAFRIASARFPVGVAASLCLKCNEGIEATALAELCQEAAGLRVSIIAKTLEMEAMEHLWQQTDCVISLHRSEGFGLVIAEALSRGIPAIVTRQGGVLDFVDDRSCYLVEGVATPLADECNVYDECSAWVEPDVDHAAESIVQVVTDYGKALRKAQLGHDTVSRLLSPEAVRDAMRIALGAEARAIVKSCV